MTDQSVSRELQIIDTARKLFAEKGYHGVKMDEVARSCNVAKGTIYLYFDSKADLFVNIFIITFSNIMKDIEYIFKRGENLRDTLEKVFTYYDKSVGENEFFKRFGETHRKRCSDLPPVIVRRIKDTIYIKLRDMQKFIAEYLTNHLENSRINIDDFSQILMSVCIGIAHSDSPTLKDTVLYVIMNGVKKEAT